MMSKVTQDIGATVHPDRLDPAYDYPGYVSTHLRAPKRPLRSLPEGLTEIAGPVFGEGLVGPLDHDLTRQGSGEPIGERLIVHGRVSDSAGRPVANQLVEIWQANAAGRYAHAVDRHQAPLDPNFSGAGRCLTTSSGSFRFITIRPGEYPWSNHDNAWRPAHIHFSVFGRSFSSRLVTQMYFPGDPLLEYDPMFQSIRDRRAADRLVARFDLDATQRDWALAYRFDVVLGGDGATPIETREAPG
jgi:protocatechuate 3,4-dioxygenase beta subunit